MDQDSLELLTEVTVLGDQDGAASRPARRGGMCVVQAVGMLRTHGAEPGQAVGLCLDEFLAFNTPEVSVPCTHILGRVLNCW